jgi:hypothetical protein
MRQEDAISNKKAVSRPAPTPSFNIMIANAMSKKVIPKGLLMPALLCSQLSKRDRSAGRTLREVLYNIKKPKNENKKPVE